MIRKSTRVAMGGLASALCLLLMFLTGLIPFSTYSLPAAAGIVLIAVVVENGYQAALMVYGAVSLLSLIIAPDREAALMFIAFFGHYPIFKFRLENACRWPRPLKKAAKFFLFNLCVVGGYALAIKLFRMSYLIEGMDKFGKYSLVIVLIMGNLLFVLYDFALSNIILFYVHVFRVKYLGRQ